MPNRLIHATSPYLLQHAHNPVNWYEWSPEALAKAKNEDKPILVSIGYSACHWCHVMERESFENADIAQIMNEHFVCIKVDREERPDIDQIYMDAVQAMKKNGGWPLNVFLTPRQEPFFGGTYFPPKNWSQLLLQIHQAFQTRRKEINESAASLAEHLNTNDTNRFARGHEGTFPDASVLDAMFQELKNRFDHTWGGIDKAPKFVMPTVWQFLLRYYVQTKNEEALRMVTLTLEKMSNGGLYDILGGGFARYSVDGEWFAPHFEKMLYDNAQFLALYAEAYACTGSDLFRKIVVETARWLADEMTHPDGGFYSALDADSEGIEGKFYTWPLAEWEAIVGKDTASAKTFQLTSLGNWEHGRNILFRKSGEAWANEAQEKPKLLAARNLRVRPGLDDKALAGWNAMTIAGLATAYRYLQIPELLQQATRALQFIETHLIENGKLYRSYKHKRGTTEGFLEDYAFLIQAYTALYQATFHEPYLHQAKLWAEYVKHHFYDPADGYFHFTSSGSERLIARKKEIFDNVIPASNSVMAANLLRLGVLLDHREWVERATRMTHQLVDITRSEPVYLSNWGIVLSELTHGLAEVVMLGDDVKKIRAEWDQQFHPFALVMGAQQASNLPLLQNRTRVNGQDTIFVCYQQTCRLPVHTVAEARQQLR
jgi:uncharacterized protein YyaL (SSP411 family)